MKYKLLTIVVAMTLMVSCGHEKKDGDDFIRVENGHFVRNGKPYYYVGTNFWY